MSRFLALGALLLVGPTTAFGLSEIIILEDSHDTPKLHLFREYKPFQEAEKEVEEVDKRLRAMKQQDIESRLGKPVGKRPNGEFAMPAGQRRGFGISGMRYADEKKNKDHKEFYMVGQDVCVEVWYGIDGITPQVIIFTFRTNKEFVPLRIPENLEPRLKWERPMMNKLKDALQPAN